MNNPFSRSVYMLCSYTTNICRPVYYMYVKYKQVYLYYHPHVFYIITCLTHQQADPIFTLNSWIQYNSMWYMYICTNWFILIKKYNCVFILKNQLQVIITQVKILPSEACLFFHTWIMFVTNQLTNYTFMVCLSCCVMGNRFSILHA